MALEKTPDTFVSQLIEPEKDSRQIFFSFWLARVGVQTLSITPGSPWKNGDIESVNRRLRAERLDRELFATLWEVKMLVERWRQIDNRFVRTVRWAIDYPHRRPSHHNGPDSHGG